PQLVTSVNRTEQVLLAGLPVPNVSGGDAHETRPAPSRVSTLTVYRLPGLRLLTVNEVLVVSPSCSLTVPFCRYTSYLTPAATAGQEMVADRSVTALAVGWPGALGALVALCAGCRTSAVSEYGASVWLVAVPVWDVATDVAPLVYE